MKINDILDLLNVQKQSVLQAGMEGKVNNKDCKVQTIINNSFEANVSTQLNETSTCTEFIKNTQTSELESKGNCVEKEIPQLLMNKTTDVS